MIKTEYLKSADFVVLKSFIITITYYMTHVETVQK